MTIEEYFRINNKAAIAFSGGVDSCFLLYAAVKAGCDVRAYYVKSEFQPRFEYDDAVRFASKLGLGIDDAACYGGSPVFGAGEDDAARFAPKPGPGSEGDKAAGCVTAPGAGAVTGRETGACPSLKIIRLSVLDDPAVASNPADRCYYCKSYIMRAVTEAAYADRYELVCDGTNASDDDSDRPGVRALREKGIVSPLRECGLRKDDIRRLCREAGLAVWNKPAYACLATRIPSGEMITADKLIRTEEAERRLYELGFRDFRVRMRGESALLQVRADQYEEASRRIGEIRDEIGSMYEDVTLDSSMR